MIRCLSDRALWLCIGGVLVTPLFASGHGAQFVLGKVTPLKDGRVRVELTADYGENPMIESAEEAREALSGLMRWGNARENDKVIFEDLPEVRFEERTQLDPTIPLPPAEAPSGEEHQLLTGIWEWKPEGDQVRFQMSKGTPLDVLLWTAPSGPSQASLRWVIMIAGDVSPVIQLEPERPNGFAVGWAVVSGVTLLGLVSWRMRRVRQGRS